MLITVRAGSKNEVYILLLITAILEIEVIAARRGLDKHINALRLIAVGCTVVTRHSTREVVFHRRRIGI